MSDEPSQPAGSEENHPYRGALYGPAAPGPAYGVAQPSQGFLRGARRGGPGTGRLNPLAVLSLVSSLLFWPLGIVLGHLARAQIRRTGQRGSGIALAGLVLSYLSLGATILVVSGAVRLPGSGG